MKNHLINTMFQFQTAGQGLFYTGKFTNMTEREELEQYTFVYDCGTELGSRYLDLAIDDFGQNFHSKEKLNMLIISHLHMDHVNKIPDLLQRTNGVREVFLPFLTDDELFLAFVEDLINGRSGDPAFYTNPATFLIEYGADKVNFIHPSEDGNNKGNEINDPINPDSTFNEENWTFKTINNLKPSPKDAGQGEIRHYFDQGSVNVSYFWEFKFFNRSHDPVDIQNLISKLESIVGKKTPTVKDIVDYVQQNPGSIKKQFRQAYLDVFGNSKNLNQTSLILYHNLLDRDTSNRKSLQIISLQWASSGCLFKGHPWRDGINGTMLTGDIPFDNNCLQELKRKWPNTSRYFKSLGVFQVPHHGAENYLERLVLMAYPNLKVCIINFGLGNLYRHPRKSIINMICDCFSPNIIFLNTQLNTYCYGADITLQL